MFSIKVVEYSEISVENSELQEEDGRLTYRQTIYITKKGDKSLKL